MSYCSYYVVVRLEKLDFRSTFVTIVMQTVKNDSESCLKMRQQSLCIPIYGVLPLRNSEFFAAYYENYSLMYEAIEKGNLL